MKARTLAVLPASYNSTRRRYIVTVIEPVGERPPHGAQHRFLPRGDDNVVE
jgi:hypothetical protein